MQECNLKTQYAIKIDTTCSQKEQKRAHGGCNDKANLPECPHGSLVEVVGVLLGGPRLVPDHPGPRLVPDHPGPTQGGTQQEESEANHPETSHHEEPWRSFNLQPQLWLREAFEKNQLAQI